MSDPWKALRERDLVLVHAPIAERGRYYHHQRAIVLRCGMSLAEQRATLWHELEHASRGDQHCCDKTERLHVDKRAARNAIPIEDLADALAWSDDPTEQAELLKITPRLLVIRLQHLHPAERGLLTRRLSMIERTA